MSRYPEGGVGWKGSAGSVGHIEAVAFEPKRLNRREEVRVAMQVLGSATALEVANKLGRHWFHVAPRLSELLAMGVLQKCADKGKTEFGRAATKYRLSTPEELSNFLARKALADEKGHNPRG